MSNDDARDETTKDDGSEAQGGDSVADRATDTVESGDAEAGGAPANTGGTSGANGGNGGGGKPPIPTVAPWTTPVFIAGIIVGLLLVSVGLGLSALMLVPTSISTIIVCAGLGIELGAFGAAATIQHQGLVITGVAALTIVLFQLLAQNMDHHLKISISNIPADMQATLYIDHEIPGARSRRDQFDFYVIEREMAAGKIKLAFFSKDAEVPFNCIPAESVRRFLGSGKTLEWSLSADQKSIEIDGQPVTCDETLVRLSSAEPLSFPSFIGSAVAQEPLEDIGTYLADLDSDDASLRRGARDGLTLYGLEAVRPMMDLWKLDPEHYRNTLGVSVALTQFLREDKRARRKPVSAILTEEDLGLLTAAIGRPDRTLRIYAGEFLFDLGDPRVIAPILTAFPEASDDGKFNSLFVLKNVVPDLDAAGCVALASQLDLVVQREQLGPKTSQLLEELKTALRSKAADVEST